MWHQAHPRYQMVSEILTVSVPTFPAWSTLGKGRMPGRKPRIEILVERTFGALHGIDSTGKGKCNNSHCCIPRT